MPNFGKWKTGSNVMTGVTIRLTSAFSKQTNEGFYYENNGIGLNSEIVNVLSSRQTMDLEDLFNI